MFREDGFEVTVEPETEEVVLMRRQGREETKVSYRYISRQNLSDQELKDKIHAGEGGKERQIEDYDGQMPLQIFVHSYFTLGQGVLLVMNKERDVKVEFTFNFEGSENLRIKGSKGEMEVKVKSRPGSEVAVVVDAINVWESMPIFYNFSYRIL